ncbi:MAG: pyruvate kinase [Thermoguttaceae bacterium]|nr:pyruvate kinase [Thermoguttaceae bacterium]
MSEELDRFPKKHPSRTKIVATLGPASDSEEMIARLIDAGVDVFRINMAHSSPETAQPVLDRVRTVSKRLGQPIGVLIDLAGPKMRLGNIAGNEYLCHAGEDVRFIRGASSDRPRYFTTTYEPLIDDLKVDDNVLLADGTVRLRVTRKEKDEVVCSVLQGGRVRSHQGLNLPGVSLSIPTLQEADQINARWGTRAGVDFIGLSFVRSPEDVEQLRTIIAAEAAMNLEATGGWSPNIIAKIEKPEALSCLGEVIEVSDGIMVARGDLGVEIPIARMPVIQKEILRRCREQAKPAIVATQMLESMTDELLPTRAEATDVANAILDGADACMLSAETAVGSHPVEAVAMMHEIAETIENQMRYAVQRGTGEIPFAEDIFREGTPSCSIETTDSVRTSQAVCQAAGALAETVGAKAIFIATKSGRTALNLSKMRNFVMTVGTSDSEEVLRRMSLYWGVIPIGGVPQDVGAMVLNLVPRAVSAGELIEGDRIVVVAGLGAQADGRNAIYLHTVR